MDTNALKAEIAWIHSVLAGLANMPEPDHVLRAEILRQLRIRWEELERATWPDSTCRGEF